MGNKYVKYLCCAQPHVGLPGTTGNGTSPHTGLPGTTGNGTSPHAGVGDERHPVGRISKLCNLPKMFVDKYKNCSCILETVRVDYKSCDMIAVKREVAAVTTAGVPGSECLGRPEVAQGRAEN